MTYTRAAIAAVLLVLALVGAAHTSQAAQIVVQAPRLTTLRCIDAGSLTLLLNALDQAGTPAWQFAPDPMCGAGRYLVAYR